MVSFEVTSTDDRPLGDITVSAQSGDPAVTVDGWPSLSFTNALRSVTGEFKVGLMGGGHHRLEILVTTSFNSPRSVLLLGPDAKQLRGRAS